MKYLICQDWKNTSGNHAGMLYLCNKMQELYPNEIRVFCIDDYRSLFRSSNRFINHFFKAPKALSLYKRRKYEIKDELVKCLKSGDEVVLMEYLELLYPINDLANSIKDKFPDVKLSAIIHLVPEKLDKAFPKEIFDIWLQPIDRIITFGSSLTKYLIHRGVSPEKIHTSFHYVDDYYVLNSVDDKPYNNRIKVLAMGNQMRNIELLKNVVEGNPNIDFIICQGVSDMSREFSGKTNVKLIPYVNEYELKDYMLKSDISLNVMKDTIGSNVIVTSLGMGMAMICSDVGSIRDYCSDSNTIFCKNTIDDFSYAINKLSKDNNCLSKMKKASLESVDKLSIKNFINNIF